MMKKPIYLDYHATTPLDPRVEQAMQPYWRELFGNPASQTHEQGRRAAQAVAAGRAQVAQLLGAEASEISFTSGATESNNWCLKALAEVFQGQKNHIVTSSIEHSCVLDTCKYLETKGFEVTYLPVDACGLVDLAALEAALTERTLVVSVMMANNEIGTINRVEEIGRLCRDHDVLFHSDAVQAVAYKKVDVRAMAIDFLSLSGHKIYGPKGIGALFIDKDLPFSLPPLIHGGGHEGGRRSGTVNVPAVVGFGVAAEILCREGADEARRIEKLRDRLWTGLCEKVEKIKLNGHKTCRSVNNLNICFAGIEAVELISQLKEDLMVSSGSACSSSKGSSSHVLKAIGVSEEDAYSNIRLSVGRWTSEEEVDWTITRLAEAVHQLST